MLMMLEEHEDTDENSWPRAEAQVSSGHQLNASSQSTRLAAFSPQADQQIAAYSRALEANKAASKLNAEECRNFSIGIQHEHGGSFTSPNYPNPYPENLICTRLIEGKFHHPGSSGFPFLFSSPRSFVRSPTRPKPSGPSADDGFNSILSIYRKSFHPRIGPSRLFSLQLATCKCCRCGCRAFYLFASPIGVSFRSFCRSALHAPNKTPKTQLKLESINIFI